jgi:hypothetical protein
MTKVYVNYCEDYILDQREPGEFGEWTQEYSFEVLNVTDQNVTPYHEDFTLDVRGHDTLWVVVVRYSTGDTFGRAKGRGYIEGVFRTQKSAERRVMHIKNGGDSLKQGYTPWHGYFEYLESVEAVEVPFKKTKTKE